MDQFNFNAPINIKIFFDDSDDETFERKPHIKEEKYIKTEENDLSKVEKDKIEEHLKNSSPKLLCSFLKTETSTSANHNMEIAVYETSNNVVSVIKNIKNDTSQPKLLDMPYLEDESIGVDNSNIYTHDHNKNEDNDSGKNISSKTQKETDKDILPAKKAVFKRKLTEKQTDTTKVQKTTEQSMTKSCERKFSKDITETIQIKKKYYDNKINPPNDNNYVQIQDKSNDAVHSKCLLNNSQGPFRIEISPIESQKQNIECSPEAINEVFMSHIEINPLSPLNNVQSIEDKTCQSLNLFNKTIVGYIKGLVDTVSEHILHILNVSQTCSQVYQANTDPVLKNKAKTYYTRTKNHFFDLSYSTVVNVIIPRSDNRTFVESFITNTIEIGRSKSIAYTYEQIESLFFDMIIWVKNKRKQLQNLISSPNLVQQLQTPPKLLNNCNNEQVPKKAPVSRKKPPQSKHPQENINESPCLSHSYQYRPPYPTVQQLHNSIPQSKPPPYTDQNRQYVERPAFHGSYHQSPRFPEQPLCLPKYNGLKQQYEHQMSIMQAKHNSIQMSNYNVEQINKAVNIQPYASNSNQSDTPYFHSVPPRINSANTTDGQKRAQTMHNNILPSYSQTCQHYQEIISSPNNSQYLEPENTTQIELNRSSISRDSGFMSPPNFNNSDFPLQEEQRQPPMTPFITHVTSLNPNAALIKNGNCTVCGKSTKQKCLGCFNCYYCSHACQFLDWKTHQLICK